MSFSNKNYIKVRDEFRRKKLAHENAAEAETLKLHIKYPEIAEIDKALSNAGLKVFAAAVEGGEDLAEKIEAMRVENLELQAKRKALLIANGLTENIDEPKYDCDKCKDEGFVDGRMCDCFRQALIDLTFETSGIGYLAEVQTFDSFSTEYFKDDPRALESIEIILMLCRDYAENFKPGASRNLLFIGNTGLGKTHLSTAIAKKVIEGGCDVVYDTAQNIFADFEIEHFSRNRDEEDRTSRYFDCDLLIIDDLGTEMTNSFTVSTLYNIINTRLNHRAAMIINTNLGQNDLRSRYSDRITSRLFGDFSPLHFIGRDVRSGKLM